jgi:hypothetical protein
MRMIENIAQLPNGMAWPVHFASGRTCQRQCAHDAGTRKRRRFAPALMVNETLLRRQEVRRG